MNLDTNGSSGFLGLRVAYNLVKFMVKQKQNRRGGFVIAVLQENIVLLAFCNIIMLLAFCKYS